MNRAVQLWVGRERRRMARAGTVGRRGARRVTFHEAHVALGDRLTQRDGADALTSMLAGLQRLHWATLTGDLRFEAVGKDGGS